MRSQQRTGITVVRTGASKDKAQTGERLQSAQKFQSSQYSSQRRTQFYSPVATGINENYDINNQEEQDEITPSTMASHKNSLRSTNTQNNFIVRKSIQKGVATKTNYLQTNAPSAQLRSIQNRNELSNKIDRISRFNNGVTQATTNGFQKGAIENNSQMVNQQKSQSQKSAVPQQPVRVLKKMTTGETAVQNVAPSSVSTLANNSAQPARAKSPETAANLPSTSLSQSQISDMQNSTQLGQSQRSFQVRQMPVGLIKRPPSGGRSQAANQTPENFLEGSTKLTQTVIASPLLNQDIRVPTPINSQLQQLKSESSEEVESDSDLEQEEEEKKTQTTSNPVHNHRPPTPRTEQLNNPYTRHVSQPPRRVVPSQEGPTLTQNEYRFAQISNRAQVSPPPPRVQPAPPTPARRLEEAARDSDQEEEQEERKESMDQREHIQREREFAVRLQGLMLQSMRNVIEHESANNNLRSGTRIRLMRLGGAPNQRLLESSADDSDEGANQRTTNPQQFMRGYLQEDEVDRQGPGQRIAMRIYVGNISRRLDDLSTIASNLSEIHRLLFSLRLLETIMPGTTVFAQNAGLTERQINEIPIIPLRVEGSNTTGHSKYNTSNHEDCTLTCTICFEEMHDGERVKALTCLHKFHPKCIDAWLKSKAVCPNCKADQKLYFE